MERHRGLGEEAAARDRARDLLSTPPLRTERLDLEPVSPAHADEMVDVVSDRARYRYYDDEPSPSVEELRARYARQAAGRSPDGREVWHTWILRERSSSTAIGFVQATVSAPASGHIAAPDDPDALDGAGVPRGIGAADDPGVPRRSDRSRGAAAELAWVVGVPWQGHGYATEASTAVRDAVLGPASATGDDATTVLAHIAPGHAASEVVARRLGLEPTPLTHDGETRWELTQRDRRSR